MATAPTTCATIRPTNEIHASRDLFFFFFLSLSVLPGTDESRAGSALAEGSPSSVDDDSLGGPFSVAAADIIAYEGCRPGHDYRPNCSATLPLSPRSLSSSRSEPAMRRYPTPASTPSQFVIRHIALI